MHQLSQELMLLLLLSIKLSITVYGYPLFKVRGKNQRIKERFLFKYLDNVLMMYGAVMMYGWNPNNEKNDTGTFTRTDSS